MQTHKNKVIETNNGKSHKQTHTHIHWSQNTDWDRAIQWEKERGKSLIFCEEWDFEWQPLVNQKSDLTSGTQTHLHNWE